MQRALPVLVGLLVALVPLPVSAHEVEHGGSYVVGTAGVTAIWCSSDSHSIVPVGDPDEYPTPEGWVFSGEPECAPGEVDNAVREAQGQERVEHGTGGFAWRYHGDQVGTTAHAWTDDVVSGTETYMTLASFNDDWKQDSISEGCGPQTVTVQPVPWNWGDEEYGLLWAFFQEVGVDDDLTVCVTTTGTVTAQYGA